MSKQYLICAVAHRPAHGTKYEEAVEAWESGKDFIAITSPGGALKTGQYFSIRDKIALKRDYGFDGLIIMCQNGKNKFHL